MHFRLERPTGRSAPVIVEIPHAGTDLPDDVASGMQVLRNDVLRDADLYVDALYRNAPRHGAVLLAATASRYIVDLNRYEHDIDPRVVPGVGKDGVDAPRGVLWRDTTEGRAVYPRPLTVDEFEDRLARFYRPYHRALEEQIDVLRARFGYVIVLSAHSMPSVGPGRATLAPVRRADVVPGTRGHTTAASPVIDMVASHFRNAGLSVRHDEPYRGGATTARWGRPSDGVHAIQVELNRALYMDERTHQRREGAFEWLASLCEGLVARLAEIDRPR